MLAQSPTLWDPFIHRSTHPVPYTFHPVHFVILSSPLSFCVIPPLPSHPAYTFLMTNQPPQ
ncbi:hypothetical protein EX30DRAFT_343312 [Ascodesmis nigricans]|uniref:Uncharacterized protein n=1 Tax=Ascodesmis nigricans TaxID=341454 RepID=A0A4S2MR87_9PEZI|nr:hypothetical protein EX30DRAFT_343312 [Ascodesmis nigricans]